MYTKVNKEVCIVGGGPAGMVLGLLLARAGIETLVIEQHTDFQRVFRGEVLQPMFSQLMRQLKIEQAILSHPHGSLSRGDIYYKDKQIGKLDFPRIAPSVKHALWMPQPILLQALYTEAKKSPHFDMWFAAPVRDIVTHEHGIRGVYTQKNGQSVEVRAAVTVGADGRFSAIRRLAGFSLAYEHYKNDVLWFQFDHDPDDSDIFRFLLTDRHNYLILPKYPDKIQAGITLRRGEWSNYLRGSVDGLRQELMAASPVFHRFAASLSDFSPFTRLQAKTYMVQRWAKDGCLLIGDAAHCSSPVGAIGISLAALTAAVAADVITEAVRTGNTSSTALSKVQIRRHRDVRRIHQLQLLAEAVLLSGSTSVRSLIPFLGPVVLGSRIGLALQRRIFTMTRPLPLVVDPCRRARS
jgi:2-polyprenyl-6-methoxyphenol hydroxylase-like FAD-dependent oxidoreductase